MATMPDGTTLPAESVDIQQPDTTYTAAEPQPVTETPYVPTDTFDVPDPTHSPAAAPPVVHQPDPAQVAMQQTMDQVLAIVQASKVEVGNIRDQLHQHKAEVAQQLAHTSQAPAPQSLDTSSTSPVGRQQWQPTAQAIHTAGQLVTLQPTVSPTNSPTSEPNQTTTVPQTSDGLVAELLSKGHVC